MRNQGLLLGFLALLIPALQGCYPGGVTAGGVAFVNADDRRTSGAQIDDKGIERKAGRQIEDKYGDQVHVDVTSYNRFVVVAGEVPSQQIKDDIGAMVLGVENVRNVQNELTVGPVPSASSKANDALLTTKVKGNFMSNKLDPNNVKVMTENGVVYLMGLVTRKEGDQAAELASKTGGVQKVVTMFEYTD
jgi:osmotically-inducible protein OsmY